jgi:hypothetical protein
MRESDKGSKKGKPKSKRILSEIGLLFDSILDGISRSQTRYGDKLEDTIIGSESGFMIEDETREDWEQRREKYISKKRRQEEVKQKFKQSKQIWWRTQGLPIPLHVPERLERKKWVSNKKVTGLCVLFSVTIFYAVYLHTIYSHGRIGAPMEGIRTYYYAEFAITNWLSIILNVWPGEGFRSAAEIFIALKYIPPEAVWINAIGWALVGLDIGIIASTMRGIERKIRTESPFPPPGSVIHS